VSKNDGTNQSGQGRPATGRELPQSQASEAAVLGSMILNARCVPDVMAMLTARDFAYAEHRHIFEVIASLYETNAGKGVDGLTVRNRLEDNAVVDKIGGLEYLQRIVESVPTAANATYYATHVRELSHRRILIATVGELAEAAYDRSQDVLETLNATQSTLLELSQRSGRGAEVEGLPDLLRRVYEVIEQRQTGNITGLPTGFHELDDLLGGLTGGQMVVVAGRPSMGKSALAMNIADCVARVQGKAVAVFSLEMTKEALAERLVCAEARCDMNRVRRGMVGQEDYTRLLSAMQTYEQAEIYIVDDGLLTPYELAAMSRRLYRDHEIGLIVVDYLQLMHMGRKAENRQLEISTISRHIKALAGELKVPIVVVSQLNRGPEARENKRPRMSDLRESGSIEQDADVVALMYRDDYYRKDEPGYIPDNLAEVIVAKQRSGPTGTVKLVFADKFVTFRNLAQVADPALPF